MIILAAPIIEDKAYMLDCLQTLYIIRKRLW